MMNGSHFVEEQSGVRLLSVVFIYNTTEQLWTVVLVHMRIYRATQQSNCGQWDWYTCVYLLCNTAEQLWTVRLVHVCIYRATRSNCGQWDWYMCIYCAAQQSNFGQWYWYTCVFSMQHRNCGQWYWYTRVYLPIPCNTATTSGTDTHEYLLCNRAALGSLLVNGASIL